MADQRDMLAQLLALLQQERGGLPQGGGALLAAMRGDHPMGGHQGYQNEDMEGPGPMHPERLLEQVPQGWMPPGTDLNPPGPPPVPPGYPDPNWYDPRAQRIPRLNIPPGKALNRGAAEQVV